MKKSIEKRRLRNALVVQMRALQDRADSEKRDLNAGEQEQFEKMKADFDALSKRVADLEELEKAEDEMADSEDRETDDGNDKNEERSRSRGTGGSGGEQRQKGPRATAEYRANFARFLRDGRITTEFRDLALSTDSAGGYLVTPVQMSEQIIIALNSLVFMRGLADIETVTEAKSLGCPTLSTDLSDADWTAEVPDSDLTPDTSMVTGRRDLTPHFLTKLIKVSNRLLQASPRTEAVVGDRLTYKFAVSEENAFLNGNGGEPDGSTPQPLGVFYPSTNGITTARDITSAVSGVITGDNIISTLQLIPQQYTKSKSFGWIAHRTAIGEIMKLKDGNQQYLWMPGLSADRPDTLRGYPIYQSEYAPTFAAGSYALCCGDFKFYKIAQTGDVEVKRLVERFALRNQTGFLGGRYVDGMPVLAAAFARLKVHA